jgi:hypothetical protein
VWNGLLFFERAVLYWKTKNDMDSKDGKLVRSQARLANSITIISIHFSHQSSHMEFVISLIGNIEMFDSLL